MYVSKIKSIDMHCVLTTSKYKQMSWGKKRRGGKNARSSPWQCIECFHMTSRRPYWCPKTMKRQPCWCPKQILWELNFFLMQTLSFVPINLRRCWSREWKHSIPAATPAYLQKVDSKWDEPCDFLEAFCVQTNLFWRKMRIDKMYTEI